MRNLPKAVSPPIGQIDTPGQRRLYAMQKIVFQSAYVLFLPWMAWPFALIHILWLGYRIQSAVQENNEGLMKKYEDLSINATGLLDLPPMLPEDDRMEMEHDEEQGHGMNIKDRPTSYIPTPTVYREEPPARQVIYRPPVQSYPNEGGETIRHEVMQGEVQHPPRASPPPGELLQPSTPTMTHQARGGYPTLPHPPPTAMSRMQHTEQQLPQRPHSTGPPMESMPPPHSGYPGGRYIPGGPPYGHTSRRLPPPPPSYHYRDPHTSPHRAYPPAQYRPGSRRPSAYPGRNPTHPPPFFRSPHGQHPPRASHLPYREAPPYGHGEELLTHSTVVGTSSSSPMPAVMMDEECSGASDREEYPILAE